MGIVLAEATHIPEVMELITACMQEMRRNGIDQWDENYPDTEVVENDVKSHSLYVLEETQGLEEKKRCIAAMSLNQEQHPAYQTVSWMGSEPVLAVHRLCVDPRLQRMGIAKRMMEFAESHAKQQQYAGIRLDTHGGNPPALKLYEGLGYRKAGEVYFRGKTTPFFCFEKIINNRSNNHT